MEREMIHIVPVKKNRIFLFFLHYRIGATSVAQTPFNENSIQTPLTYNWQINGVPGIQNCFFTTTLKRDGASMASDLNTEAEKMLAPVTTILPSTNSNLHHPSGWSIT
jgi:hypothetical protein